VIHVVVFGLALQVSKSKAARRATSVAIVGEKKKKAEKKKEEDKPKPKPKPQVASARPESSHTPAPSPTKAAPEPTNAPAPVETGLTMGNDDGPGIAIGGPAPKGPQQQQKKDDGGGQKSAGSSGPAKKDKVLGVKNDNPEEDNCTEAPSKPVPLQKPNEVGYTQEARANGVEGILKLRLVIGADGSVVEVSVLKSVDAALDAAAIAAIKTWVFKPSMRCGKAMAGGVFTFQSTFELGD
jgi:protein TonB